MITSKPAFDREELLEWHLQNTRSDVNLLLPNDFGVINAHHFSAYNAPEFLHILLSNRHFETTKEKSAMLFYVHGGQIHCVFTFIRTLHPREWPAFQNFMGIERPYKSHKVSWFLDEAPLRFPKGAVT